MSSQPAEVQLEGVGVGKAGRQAGRQTDGQEYAMRRDEMRCDAVHLQRASYGTYLSSRQGQGQGQAHQTRPACPRRLSV
jgi:hypothetical protein